MNKEEKEAIEQLKKVIYNEDYTSIDLHTIFGFTTWNNCFETILNLIEKQQKEIEEYKETINALKPNLEELIAMSNFAMQKDYISKDKIRDKIKELEDLMILFTNDKEKFNRYKYSRNILEKLLEE